MTVWAAHMMRWHAITHARTHLIADRVRGTIGRESRLGNPVKREARPLGSGSTHRLHAITHHSCAITRATYERRLQRVATRIGRRSNDEILCGLIAHEQALRARSELSMRVRCVHVLAFGQHRRLLPCTIARTHWSVCAAHTRVNNHIIAPRRARTKVRVV
jgi:hypothetical protein